MIDIFFNFGQHYYYSLDSSVWLQFALTVFGAFLGFGTALFIYYKKLKKEKNEQKRKQETENRNRLKYHKLLFENLVKITQNQIKYLENYKVEQEKDLLNIIPIKQVATNDFKRLVFINKEIFDALNYFNKNQNEWIEQLKKLHITIDYIEGTFKEIRRINSNHLKENYKDSSYIKQKIELIPDRLSSYAFYLQKQLGEERWNNGLYVFVNTAIKKHQELVDEKADFNKFNLEYLEPMLNTILENFKDETFFEEIMFLAKSARVKMNDIKNNVQNVIIESEKIKQELEKSLEKIAAINLSA
jgi:hypothetical protein